MTPKHETTSPTVSLESVFMTSAIEAQKGREIVVADIPGVYLDADVDEKRIARFDCTMAEILVRIDPKIYKP